MWRVHVFVVAVTLVIICCLVAFVHTYKPKPIVEAKPAPTAPCVAGPNELCPTAEWLKDYDEWKALNDKIEGAMKKDRDLRTGWASRLNESMPQGYYFDVTDHKFRKREAPPVAPPHK